MAASAEELELMTKLLAFYKKRYNGVELETKFNDACEDLIDTGDLKNASYIMFCAENDIEPRIRPKKTTSSSGSSFDWSCGPSPRSYTRC